MVSSLRISMRVVMLMNRDMITSMVNVRTVATLHLGLCPMNIRNLAWKSSQSVFRAHGVFICLA